MIYEDEIGKIEYEARLWVDGVANRCRKSKLHLSDLGYQSQFVISEELRAAAVAELSNFRQVKSAKLVLTEVRVLYTDTGGSITMGSVGAQKVEEQLV